MARNAKDLSARIVECLALVEDECLERIQFSTIGVGPEAVSPEFCPLLFIAVESFLENVLEFYCYSLAKGVFPRAMLEFFVCGKDGGTPPTPGASPLGLAHETRARGMMGGTALRYGLGRPGLCHDSRHCLGCTEPESPVYP